jgi:WD40 repeat protein
VPLQGHADWVESVAFSPEGAFLASASTEACDDGPPLFIAQTSSKPQFHGCRAVSLALTRWQFGLLEPGPEIPDDHATLPRY